MLMTGSWRTANRLDASGQEHFAYRSSGIIVSDNPRWFTFRPNNQDVPVPGRAQPPLGDPHGRHLRIDPHIRVADPAPAIRPPMGLVAAVEGTPPLSPTAMIWGSALVTRSRPTMRYPGSTAGRSASRSSSLLAPPPPSRAHCPSRRASTCVSCQMQPTPRRANIDAATSPSTSTVIAAKRRRRLNLRTGSTHRDSIRATLSATAS